jgi:transcriptional regulator of NAD metabolism
MTNMRRRAYMPHIKNINTTEILGGKLNKSKLDTLSEGLETKIKTVISEWSENKFKQDVHKLEKYLDKDIQVILIRMFLQLGRNGNLHDKTFEFMSKNESILYIQPKIKNYVTFKNKENAERYIQEESSDDELNLILEVQNGKIIL